MRMNYQNYKHVLLNALIENDDNPLDNEDTINPVGFLNSVID